MPQLDGKVIRERAAALRQLGKTRQSRLFDHAIGSRDQMLIESGNAGHGRNFAKMHLAGDYVPAGTLVDVKVMANQADLLVVERC